MNLAIASWTKTDEKLPRLGLATEIASLQIFRPSLQGAESRNFSLNSVCHWFIAQLYKTTLAIDPDTVTVEHYTSLFWVIIHEPALKKQTYLNHRHRLSHQAALFGVSSSQPLETGSFARPIHLPAPRCHESETLWPCWISL
jgi:hypothetical protein